MHCSPHKLLFLRALKLPPKRKQVGETFFRSVKRILENDFLEEKNTLAKIEVCQSKQRISVASLRSQGTSGLEPTKHQKSS